MPVTYLELENFKSYGGVQKIGPFANFSCIIGPNGSGKSNCMDALSFVLGVQSRDLRSSQMKDLIFRPAGTPRTSGKLTASASLYYEDATTGETTKFQRTITARGVGDYRINSKSCSFKEYEAKLGEIGVLVKARNFLVFQGDVENLARKTPAEFVELLEQISLSAELKAPYEEALKAKEEAEAATLFCYNKQKGMKGERRMLKEQKEEAERFGNLLDERQTVQTDYFLWQLYHMELERREREAHLQDLNSQMEEGAKQEQEHTKILKEAKKKASAARRGTQAIDKERIELAGEVNQLAPSMIQVEQEVKTFQRKLEQDEKQLTAKNQEAEQHDSKVEELDQKIATAKQEKEELQKDYEEAKKEAAPDQVTLTSAQEEEYERVRVAAAAASVEPRRQLTSLQKKLETARARAAETSSQLAEVKARKTEVTKEVADLTDRSTKIKEVRSTCKVCFVGVQTN